MAESNLKSFTVIPTLYKGITFRSRQEARWAFFMDCIEVHWTYEPEGYLIGGVKYLPDFFLHQQDCFLEIKPLWPTNQEEQKCGLLAMETGKDVFLMQAPIILPNLDKREGQGAIHYLRLQNGFGTEEPYLWCECLACGLCELRDASYSQSPFNSCVCRRRSGQLSSFESERITRAFYLAAAERWWM